MEIKFVNPPENYKLGLPLYFDITKEKSKYVKEKMKTIKEELELFLEGKKLKDENEIPLVVKDSKAKERVITMKRGPILSDFIPETNTIETILTDLRAQKIERKIEYPYTFIVSDPTKNIKNQLLLLFNQ